MSPNRSGQREGRRRSYRDVNGILLLDKPTGMTSNRALQQAKRIFQARKAGHTGSLDPLASGMLPLCFGQATKVSAWLLESDKTYSVEMQIGTRTDTADADGQVVEAAGKDAVSREELEQALVKFRGHMTQIPPMYSALKKDGKRLYELARQGQEVEREPRPVFIHELRIEQFDPQRPQLFVRCGKGTYVRTLVEDIAEQMDTFAHVSALRRLTVGSFADEPMVTLDQLEQLAGDNAALDALLVPSDRALSGLGEVRLAASEAFYLRHGHAVGQVRSEATGLVRIYDETGLFLGVGEVQADGRVAPKRLFTAAA